MHVSYTYIYYRILNTIECIGFTIMCSFLILLLFLLTGQFRVYRGERLKAHNIMFS